MTLEDAVILLYSLKRDRSSGHEKPHKPVLLLAIMDLIETGEIVDNRIQPGDRLRELFRSYFEVVKQGNDQCSPENPFYFLSGESFWQLVMAEGETHIYDGVAHKSAPSWRQLQARVSHAEIDPGLFAHMANPVDREILRGAIYRRYFPKLREALQLLCMEHTQKPGSEAQSAAEDPAEMPGRDSGFRKIIREIYDYRCSACGLRIHISNVTLVEAAHIMPFHLTRNDNPTNGIALCRNHHYSMDQGLIAPGPDLRWHTSGQLDGRRDGEADLLQLDRQGILLPKDKKYYPDEEALEWRVGELI